MSAANGGISTEKYVDIRWHVDNISGLEVSRQICSASFFLEDLGSVRLRNKLLLKIKCSCEWDFELILNFSSFRGGSFLSPDTRLKCF